MMRSHDAFQAETPDPLAGQPTDQYGIPVSVAHSPQTDLPVWQYIHQLATPLPNSKGAERPHTHICVLCAASPPLRPTGKKVFTWRNALMRQRMSTNAVSHLQRVHPEEFVAIADYKQRKREALEERAAAKASEGGQPRKKRAKRTPGPRRKSPKAHAEDAHGANESEPADATPIALVARTQGSAVSMKTPSAGALARKRAVGKAADLFKTWLISSGLPVSTLQDETFQQLMRLSPSAIVAMPTAANLNAQVQDEFAKFRGFLKVYLAAESQAAMGLPFLTLRHEFRPISAASAEDAARAAVVTPSQEKAFLSVAAGFIDSQWRRVDLVLAAKEVPRGWDQQVNQLVSQTVSEAYEIDSISNYARFHVGADEGTSSALAAGGEYESTTDKQEDLLTRTLRGCVIDALGVGADSSFGGETDVRRILRLLQELVRYFEAPDRAAALTEISAEQGVQVPPCSASLIDELAVSTSTSIGALAELLRVSCARYRGYCLYFQSPVRPTATEPELETAWVHLSMDDWRAVTEIEAALNQLAQFRLEECLAPRPGAVSPSYALLFRRLLGVTAHATSLKCLSLEDDSGNRAGRRKSKRVDGFTPAGQQCVIRLRELIMQQFPAPTTTSAADDEIKAMLLDPRISSKAASLVTDARAFRRAQEALRQEHRVVFELIASRQSETTTNVEEEEEEDDEDDDEMSALLMVDGPKNQPPAAPSTTSNGRRSSDAVAEDEARAWREWQQVYVAWDTLASEGADLFDKGQYNLLKLYHHVNILKWFREVGQQAHPAAALLARMYLGHESSPSRSLGASLLRFTKQEEADWVSGAVQRAEKRCILHQNWHQYQQLSASVTLSSANDENVNVSTV
ncbi:uncharacterized protein IUM83_17896 [Phytophthora cinnamomi]|uniref:uncharacterized protein n=1 Tax=Phytophthora cinnamomi TaxID=4785 RepID=UPI003559D548|nr:hypothetical protein IUM83_17896 [Phytophthora cinnamomi]